MILLTKKRSLNLQILKDVLNTVFKARRTHSLPKKIEKPPEAWQIPYNDLAKECSVSLSLEEAFCEVEKIYSQVPADPKL